MCICPGCSLKLWSFYCDLEESLGTLESAKAVYDQILELRIATPQIILNFALFLQVCISPLAPFPFPPYILARASITTAQSCPAVFRTSMFWSIIVCCYLGLEPLGGAMSTVAVQSCNGAPWTSV